jgi:PKD repeat protein
LGKGLLYLNFPMLKQMEVRTGIRYLVIIFGIICIALVAVVCAGCGINPNPFDPNESVVTGNGFYPPVADFSGVPLQGYAPMVVTFTDKSTNNPTYWVWSFGDGTSSNTKNPIHIYELPGIYTVTLTAGNAYGGNSLTKADYVLVDTTLSAPVVDFTANVTSGYVPLTVEFTDLSAGGVIISRQWTFSKSGYSISEMRPDQKISHSFTEPGTYDVTLTIADNNNNSSSLKKSYYISVKDPLKEQDQVTLHPGWNLVSTPLPLKGQLQTASVVFAVVDTDSHSIYSYDAGSKQFVALNSQSVIPPLEGIWVYSKNERNITFNYEIVRPVLISKHMFSGWNLVGYPSTVPGNAGEGFGSIGNIWSTILGFDPVTQQYDPAIFNEGNGGQGNQRTMDPVKGYWIYMPFEGNLVITIN